MTPIRVLALLEATTVTGPAKNLLQFASLVRGAGFDPPIDITIATFRRPDDSTVLLEAARAAGVQVYAVPESGIFDRNVLPAVRAVTRKIAPDIIQTHAIKSHFVLRWAELDRHAPWIAFHHGYTWQDLRVRIYNQLDRWSLRRARRVVTVSKPFRTQLIWRGVKPERITVVHNAIDPDWGAASAESGRALRRQLAIPEDRRIILIVGRLSREKDHITLTEAVARLHEQGASNPHLLIVGDGDEKPRIQRRLAELNLNDRVTFTGQVGSAQPYYGISDVAVLPSRTEGSPNALLEAMSAAIPVVATGVGGIPEMVTHGESALLVKPGSVSGLADALAAVLTDADLARSLTVRARMLVERRHSPAERARALHKVYRELAANLKI